MSILKYLAAGAVALGLMGVAAQAQTRAEIEAAFTNHLLTVDEYRDPNAPSDFSMTVEFRAGNVARFVAYGDEEAWAIWRVSGRQICTTVSMLQGNTLVPVEDEECLRVRFNGDQVQLNFPSSTGGVIYYVGRLTPL
ncbi:hypothetical protein [Gymnodinialimonas hymeniacidonis]|uniref:hypothetical protein n=1 Tax=Gymnodinialimonas hymeniacidonis TaxID=3126508 RepID=UPI0034C6460B